MQQRHTKKHQSAVEIIRGSSSYEARNPGCYLETKTAPVSKSRSIRSLFFTWCFQVSTQEVKWHWVGGIIKTLTSQIRINVKTELKQSGSTIIHSFNQTYLVVKTLHYYSWEMGNITKQAKAKKKKKKFIQILQSNRFLVGTPTPS